MHAATPKTLVILNLGVIGVRHGAGNQRVFVTRSPFEKGSARGVSAGFKLPLGAQARAIEKTGARCLGLALSESDSARSAFTQPGRY
jgi:hypothetical protein